MKAIPAAADDFATVLSRLNVILRSASIPDGVTPAQARTLATLRDSGEQRVTELAGLEGISQPSMSALVQRMERLGWVSRRPAEADARGVVVSLTASGQQVLSRIVTERARIMSSYLHSLSPTDRRTLDDCVPVLARLAAQAQRTLSEAS